MVSVERQTAEVRQRGEFNFHLPLIHILLNKLYCKHPVYVASQCSY